MEWKGVGRQPAWQRWDRALDRESKDGKNEEGTPSSQMLRYLRRIDDRTQGKLRWGILTNGRLWRLYFHAGTGTSENFLEIDLGKALQVAGCAPDMLDKAPHGFDEVRQGALFLLYRLLFVLYAEDRNLLPAIRDKSMFTACG
jgi:hypothetical protein